jgi:hypothetical protein
MQRALVLAVVLAGFAEPSLGQDMAAAARRERERRKKAQEGTQAATVVTNETLKTTKGTLANEPGAAPPPAAKAPGGSPGNPSAVPESGRGRQEAEQQWHTRAAALSGEIERWQQRYDYWSSLYLAPGDYFVDDEGHKLVGSPENLAKLIARAKARLDEAKQALADLEDAARRENVPPGWLR